MRKHHVILTEEQVIQLEQMLTDDRLSQSVKNRCMVLLNLNESTQVPISEQEAAKRSGVHLSTVGNILRLYSHGGVNEVVNLRRHINSDFARRKIDKKTAERIISIFKDNPPEGHVRWTYRLLNKYVKERLGITISHTTIRRVIMKKKQSTNTYCIGDHLFTITIDTKAQLFDKFSNYQLFYDIKHNNCNPLFHLHITDLSHIESSTNNQLPVKNTSLKNNGICIVDCKPDGSTLSVLWIKKDYSQGTLYIANDFDPETIKHYIFKMYTTCTVPHQTLIFHSVVIEYKGKGYLILGKSGTGKSTHSRLWARHIPGARIINDDQPVVRILPDGTAWVYGTPWGGKSPVYCNEKYPIGGIVQLAQAPVNKIRPIKGFEAYSDLIVSIFSIFSVEQTDRINETISKLISIVPFWHLDCQPNKEAAILCCKTITKE